MLTDQDYSLELDGKLVPGSWTEDDLKEIAGEALAIGRLWEHPLLRVICFGELATQADYDWRNATRAWAARYDRDHPCLTPEKPMDPRTLPATDF